MSESPPEETPKGSTALAFLVLALVLAVPVAGAIGLHHSAPRSLFSDDIEMGWLEAIATTLVSLGCLVGSFVLAVKVKPVALLLLIPALAYAIWLAHDNGLPWTASVVVAPIVAVLVLVVLAFLFAVG